MCVVEVEAGEAGGRRYDDAGAARQEDEGICRAETEAVPEGEVKLPQCHVPWCVHLQFLHVTHTAPTPSGSLWGGILL